MPLSAGTTYLQLPTAIVELFSDYEDILISKAIEVLAQK